MVATMPLDRVREVYDFTEFVNERIEKQDEDAKWAASTAQNAGAIERLKSKLRANIKSGDTLLLEDVIEERIPA